MSNYISDLGPMASQKSFSVPKDATLLLEVEAWGAKALQDVADRIEVKKMMDKGIKRGDQSLIEKSLRKAKDLEADYGDFCRSLVDEGNAAMERIRREKQHTDTLLEAIITDQIGGVPGSLKIPGSLRATNARLSETIAKAKTFNLSTFNGKRLLFTAEALRKARQLVLEDDWSVSLEKCLSLDNNDATGSNECFDSSFHHAATDEIDRIMGEYESVQSCRALTAAIRKTMSFSGFPSSEIVKGLKKALENAAEVPPCFLAKELQATKACAVQAAEGFELYMDRDWNSLRKGLPRLTMGTEDERKIVHKTFDLLSTYGKVRHAVSGLRTAIIKGGIADNEDAIIETKWVWNFAIVCTCKGFFFSSSLGLVALAFSHSNPL